MTPASCGLIAGAILRAAAGLLLACERWGNHGGRTPDAADAELPAAVRHQSDPCGSGVVSSARGKS